MTLSGTPITRPYTGRHSNDRASGVVRFVDLIALVFLSASRVVTINFVAVRQFTEAKSEY